MNKLEFNDFVRTFPHEIFGDLTIIKSQKEENTYWFVGKEIQNVLGFKNLGQVINDADLDNDEVLVLNKRDNPRLFNDFVNHYNDKVNPLNGQSSVASTVSKYSSSITLIKESGLYGLGMASRKPIAKEFRRAIRKDILPGLRNLFETYNSIELNTEVELHLDVEYQKLMSKYYNSSIYKDGGKYGTMMANRSITLKHTQKTPSYWKKTGKEEAVKRGIAPSKISSGLDGLRLLLPEKSCCISQYKNLLKIGIAEKNAFRISNSNTTTDFFKLLIENNITPIEFMGSKKK